MDPQSRAADLSAALLAANTPAAISSALSAVISFLSSSPSPSRPFFSTAFPSLLRRLFVDRPSLLSSSPHAPLLLSLLLPNGPLLSSISGADRIELLHFIFPSERLPQSLHRLSFYNVPTISPLLGNRLLQEGGSHHNPGRISLRLNLFEYYFFWFAYYPVSLAAADPNSISGGAGETPPASTRTVARFRIENWMGRRAVGRKDDCADVYLKLLYSYLKAFVPKNGDGSYLPYRSSLRNYSTGDGGDEDDSGGVYHRAEFLVHAFVHFWMVDNDFSPVSLSVCRSFGLDLRPRGGLVEAPPPTPGLGEVLRLLVMYLNYDSVVGKEGLGVKPGGERRAVASSEACGSGSWNAVVQRPLYRFILRSFLFCPVGSSMKNVSQVFAVWVMYMEPWKIRAEDFAEFEPRDMDNAENSRKEARNTGRDNRPAIETKYSPAWENYVLSNYLYYSSLVVHFLGFAHKFLHANADSAIQMVSKVLEILTSSRELLDLIRKVDSAYQSKGSKSPGTFSSPSGDAYKYVPSICEQLTDWEDGLCESDTDGSFLCENWNRDLKLFSNSEEGAANLLELFLLRAEHEIRLASGDVANKLQALDPVRSQMNILFGRHTRSSQPALPEETYGQHQGRSEVFTPKHPGVGKQSRSEGFTPKHPGGVGKQSWADLTYKGDWMHRPISDTEVAWLARCLIKVSDYLNERLGLDRIEESDNTGPTFVEVSRDNVCTVGGAKEFFSVVFVIIISWLGLFGNAMVSLMRKHRMKINLRALASKNVLMLLPLLYAVFWALKKAFHACICIY